MADPFDVEKTPLYPELVEDVAHAISRAEAPLQNPDADVMGKPRWQWHVAAAEASIKAVASYLKAKRDATAPSEPPSA